MTEAEWLTCQDPRAMLGFLRGRGSARRWRLLTSACVRCFWQNIASDRHRRWFEELERGQADVTAAEAARLEITSPAVGTVYLAPEPNAPPFVVVGSLVAADTVVCLIEAMSVFNEITAECCGVVIDIPIENGAFVEYGDVLYRVVPTVAVSAESDDPGKHAAFVRDLFGNPFRAASFNPAWRTWTVVNLATAAYEARNLPSGQLDPIRLAILADALEEAGCTDAAILDHLRSPGPHVRGCWAVDLILAK